MNPTPSPDQGLRSAPGIRWLLLAGALVTGVSIYRLVEAQWTAIPVPLQFLVLVAGALTIFLLGNVTRRRLHLPYAGSALLFLFTGLVPVLAWGAAYLRLLDTVWGWLAFSAGGAALLGAAVSVMRSELRYPGRLYPAALGTLFVAQAVLPSLGVPGDRLLYILAAGILGAVLYTGSLHINRFFFHRDQRDGRDRNLHLVPFLLLSVLYLGALALLDPHSTFLALPLAVVGIVLAGTGEEYYRALVDSLGRTPEKWPLRSVALLALGFSLTVVSLFVALMDSSNLCLCLTALCATGLFLRWSLRYSHATVHGLGVLAAFAAWNAAPPLEFLRNNGPILLGWNELGFLTVLTGLGMLLVWRKAPDRLLRTHGALTALQIAGIAILGLGFGEAGSGLPLLSATLGVALLGLAPSFIVALLAATLAIAAFVIHGPSSLPAETAVLMAGALWMMAGYRFRQRSRFVMGGLMLSLGIQGAILLQSGLAVWSEILVASLILAGAELGLLLLAARRFPGRLLAARFHVELEDWDASTAIGLADMVRVWLVLSAAACLLFAGFDALVLGLVMVVILFLVRTETEGWARRLALPARLSLIPLLQLAVLAAAGGHPARDLPLALIDEIPALLPWIALCGLAWRGLIEMLGRRRALLSWTVGVEIATALCFLIASLGGLLLWANVTMLAVALGWAAVSFLDARRDRDPLYGWQMQAWVGLAVLQGFTAGWLHLGSGIAPYVLLAVGATQYALGAFFEHRDLGPALTPSSRFVGLGLPLMAGFLSLDRISVAGSVWIPVLATCLVSLFYTIVALRDSKRVFPSLASVAFLALALMNVISLTHLGRELYFLAPGLALLALAWLLRAELGPTWSRHVAAAGASFVYATPIVALADEISWGWLCVLLVTAIAFGAASFTLRSRSLLTVSTAALLTDLGFIVFRIGTTAPMALWVLGLGFGLALMATAAWLEYRREGVLQQIRVFGRELRAWS